MRLFFIALFAALLVLPACSTTEDPEVAVVDLLVGTGETAAIGDSITVTYVGRIPRGDVFDEGTATFLLRPGQLIDGWIEGIPGMKVGGRRRLTIPPALAYGSDGIRNYDGSWIIPPNATLEFDVELRAVKHPPSKSN